MTTPSINSRGEFELTSSIFCHQICCLPIVTITYSFANYFGSRFEFPESFVNDELAGVFDVVRVIHDNWFDVFPVPVVSVEAVGFVADASGFETPTLQVVATPRVNV
ncbi:hypothetical protein [Halapricum hydrolyticum]|uniref:Uncharacterized protein n=1 Tax=Halapricum hydrolyticum TaxID=2979991 RepID=A0AAE3I9T7_9EURY|nr:hypothetical protein [Halapricum hydrolyticum]MCU4716701.1 hypothetical protein [Halapricum hydrolyticum]MCU4725694.1 hypothetical protein [Halapricum hydrolyticum]